MILKTGFILILISTALIQERTGSEWDKVVDIVSKRLQCSTKDAGQFILYLDYFLNRTETSLSAIASHETNNKDDLISTTIKSFFLDGNSTVQVSSLRTGRVNIYAVSAYLNNLAHLSKVYYTEVYLTFDPDYLSLGPIEKYTDPTYGDAYEFNVTVWQTFRGYRDGQLIYEDNTRKTFHFIFIRIGDKWQIRIKHLSVAQTVTLDEFEKIKKRWRINR